MCLLHKHAFGKIFVQVFVVVEYPYSPYWLQKLFTYSVYKSDITVTDIFLPGLWLKFNCLTMLWNLEVLILLKSSLSNFNDLCFQFKIAKVFSLCLFLEIWYFRFYIYIHDLFENFFLHGMYVIQCSCYISLYGYPVLTAWLAEKTFFPIIKFVQNYCKYMRHFTLQISTLFYWYMLNILALL